MKNLTIVSILLIVFCFYSCENKDIVQSIPKTSSSDSPERIKAENVLNYIKSLGFKEANIEEQDSIFIVEGDIVFRKSMVLPQDYSAAKIDQRFSGYSDLLSISSQDDIKIKIDPSMSSMTSEITAAVNMWNSVSYCRLNLVIVSSSSYDILIVDDASIGFFTCGNADFPSAGTPGTFIKINKNLLTILNTSYSQNVSLIAHELGHNFGLTHTDSIEGIEVPGWGGTDANSIMNANMCGSAITSFSSKDLGAIRWLYPSIYMDNKEGTFSVNENTIRNGTIYGRAGTNAQISLYSSGTGVNVKVNIYGASWTSSSGATGPSELTATETQYSYGEFTMPSGGSVYYTFEYSQPSGYPPGIGTMYVQ